MDTTLGLSSSEGIQNILTMPATYRIYSEKPWIEIMLSGEIFYSELRDFHGRMFADPTYSDDLCGLIDCREMTNVLNVNELRRLADLHLARPGHAWRSKRAVLVASPAQYGAGQVFMVFAESSPVKYSLFYNLEAAFQWLKE